MTVITTFPTIRNVLYSGDNLISMTPAPTNAAGVISAGMIVTFNATGVGMTVDACQGIQPPFGVALYDSSGTAASRISIAGPGCIVYVANSDDQLTFDAGDYCMGTSAFSGAASGVAPGAVPAIGTANIPSSTLGIWLDDVAGGGTGRVLICPMCIGQ